MPIVEPEVLMDGDHTLARCEEVTDARARLGHSGQLFAHRVHLEGMVLKPNMVISGKKAAKRAGAGRSRRGHGALPQASRTGGGAGHRVPVGRAERSGSHGAPGIS